MTWEIAWLLCLLAGMLYLILTEKIPVDLTAFLVLALLVLTGLLSPAEAFTGFSSPTVITMIGSFMISTALRRTGIAEQFGGKVYTLIGNREALLILTVMLASGALSAFMNNIAAAAVFMPAVAGIARRANLSPARLYMPLAFGVILGGTITLVGTPPNIVAADMLQSGGFTAFSLFDFTPLGLAILISGTLFMVTLGRRLLPAQGSGIAVEARRDLAQLYQLNQQLFSIRIPKSSRLAGLTLGEARLGTALGVQVVSILRSSEKRGEKEPGEKRHREKRLAPEATLEAAPEVSTRFEKRLAPELGDRFEKRLAPEASTRLEADDVLLVLGRQSDLEELLRVQGAEIQRFTAEPLRRPTQGVGGIRARLVPGATLLGRTLRELKFRERFGVVVVGIERTGKVISQQLGQVALAEGDAILALGTRTHLEKMLTYPDLQVEEIGLSAVQELQEHLFLIRIPKGSPLAGTTIGASRIGELAGVTVGGILRGEEMLLAVLPSEVIREGDALIVTGEPERILRLLEVGEVHLDAAVSDAALESDEVGVFEATVAPRSLVAGKTLGELEFRERYGLQVLAVWRGGEPIHRDFANLGLQVGDALLLQGPWERTQKLATDPDFVVLAESAQPPKRTRKGPLAVAGLALMIALVLAGYQPIHVAAFIAATGLVLAGALTMEEAYRAIDWRSIFVVASLLPLGLAMERSGVALLLARGVSQFAGDLGPYAVLGALVVLSSLLSQCIDGAPAVVLLAPVALKAAEQFGLSPYPLMMGVGLAASAAFMTPFSHKVNLLVMGAGGYRTRDYLRAGTPLTGIFLLLIVLLTPLFFPF